MRPKDKDARMDAFAAGAIDILVSTTVIEVGVDVPNATLMVVEHADRFGLSQLHQLRGRVGRGNAQSYCVLISDSQQPETKKRLKILTQTSDGFQLAEEDLRLRGPGDFFGLRQHGLPGLRVADLGCDQQLLRQAQSTAQNLLTHDPDLTASTALKKRVAALFAGSGASLN
jgi:ATP-dependent DNA helicase RecG